MPTNSGKSGGPKAVEPNCLYMTCNFVFDQDLYIQANVYHISVIGSLANGYTKSSQINKSVA